MTWVQKLAEAACPDCSGQGNSIARPCDCPTCHGTEHVVELWRECPNKTVTPGRIRISHFERCEACQGCGWVLIPEREVMGVLMRVDIGLCETGRRGDGRWYLSRNKDGRRVDILADTPEEARAHAICQAQGIE